MKLLIELSGEALTPELQAVLEKALQSGYSLFELAPDAEVSVLMLEDETEMRRINQEMRGIDASTDVLSFPAMDAKKPGLLQKPWALNPMSGRVSLGDMVINLVRMRLQAEEYGHSQARELAFLAVHSLCHLMGYDHQTMNQTAIMRAMEEKALTVAGYEREQAVLEDQDSIS